MSRKSLVVLVVMLLVPSVGLMAQAQMRIQKPNDFNIELGGRCILYTLSYQRMLGQSVALEAGFSYVGTGVEGVSESVFFLTGGARYYFLKRDASPYISGGLVYVSAATDAGPLDVSTGSAVYFHVTPGFELRLAGGFVFRGGVNILFRDSFFFVWPGLALGIAF